MHDFYNIKRQEKENTTFIKTINQNKYEIPKTFLSSHGGSFYNSGLYGIFWFDLKQENAPKIN